MAMGPTRRRTGCRQHREAGAGSRTRLPAAAEQFARRSPGDTRSPAPLGRDVRDDGPHQQIAGGPSPAASLSAPDAPISWAL